MANFIFILISVSFALSRAQEIVNNKVTPEESKAILAKLNSLRALIAQGKVEGQPRGIDVFDLAWDDRLAEEAQKIANTLKFEHVTVNDPRWDYVGQTMGQTYSFDDPITKGDWNYICEAWFSEHKNFQYPTTEIGDAVTGHYQQVVWADTKYVGCGYASWFDKSDPQYKGKDLFICNYGPGAEIGQKAPYKTG